MTKQEALDKFAESAFRWDKRPKVVITQEGTFRVWPGNKVEVLNAAGEWETQSKTVNQAKEK